MLNRTEVIESIINTQKILENISESLVMLNMGTGQFDSQTDPQLIPLCKELCEVTNKIYSIVNQD